uniref:Uncharacterized protein n=1 Tax=uncultured marine virus TaxID=186617 RepID=A0A0F7L940_9VIRU|nr:hypothetical protein [uncultured marine virus]
MFRGRRTLSSPRPDAAREQESRSALARLRWRGNAVVVGVIVHGQEIPRPRAFVGVDLSQRPVFAARGRGPHIEKAKLKGTAAMRLPQIVSR